MLGETEHSDWLERRGVTDPRILEAMRSIDRDAFYGSSNGVDAHSSRLDRTTITPPEVIAKMIVAMDLPDSANVLQIGTGTGYIPAILSKMSHAVFTTETDPDSARVAAERLQNVGIKNVSVLYGATLNEYAANGPYQAILISAGMARIPDRLAKRLSVGGILVAPVGVGRKQQLVRLLRKGEEEFETEVLGDLRVMPLLGDILVEMGVVDREDVEIAALEADVGGKMLGEALLDGLDVKESDIYRALAQQRETTLLTVRTALSLLDRTLIGTIPRAFLTHNRLVPIDKRDGVLRIATTDSECDTEQLAGALGLPEVQLLLITPTDYQMVWEAIDNKARREMSGLEQTSEVGEEDLLPLSAETIASFEKILHEAIGSRASDVHFEREEETVRVRFRVDGVLRPFTTDLNPARLAEIVHLVKVSARMDRIGVRLPRSGHFQRRFANQVYDIRAHVLPGMFGEHMTLRILSQNSDVLSLAELGFIESITKPLRDVLKRGRGIVLVVGPSGSGTSTTMYSMLHELSLNGDKKIAAIEHPVTYALPGVQQVRVDPSIGFGLEEAVEATLRTDVDVVLMGELGTPRLCELAVQASRGGLLVLATFRGREVLEAFDRFEELGVSKNAALTEVEAVIAQQLLKRICVNCRQPARITPFARRMYPSGDPPIFTGLGCTQCADRGTRGRVALGSFIRITDAVRNALATGDHTKEEIAAIASIYVRKTESARALVERGTTSLSEIEFLEF